MSPFYGDFTTIIHRHACLARWVMLALGVVPCAIMYGMGGRIFLGFLIIVTVSILFMIPVTQAVYDYRTDVREDSFNIFTFAANTTGNMTLLKAIYDNDTSTLGFISNNTSDLPLYFAYNTTTRELEVSGLAANQSRLLDVSYDVDALGDAVAVSTLAWPSNPPRILSRRISADNSMD